MLTRKNKSKQLSLAHLFITVFLFVFWFFLLGNVTRLQLASVWLLSFTANHLFGLQNSRQSYFKRFAWHVKFCYMACGLRNQNCNNREIITPSKSWLCLLFSILTTYANWNDTVSFYCVYFTSIRFVCFFYELDFEQIWAICINSPEHSPHLRRNIVESLSNVLFFFILRLQNHLPTCISLCASSINLKIHNLFIRQGICRFCKVIVFKNKSSILLATVPANRQVAVKPVKK